MRKVQFDTRMKVPGERCVRAQGDVQASERRQPDERVDRVGNKEGERGGYIHVQEGVKS